ncbi:aromatic ring-hydroxylating dioxygenase subunit alpha [Mangrovimicrobium sediminis]|uniref:Aromatic ring-hydroxylating dioxygenase subunit alpha n=1 Tax=Mangrovimicrobium sediminis TaxID=2562682 RepID=A0A4Z0M501_9GAMM|nr:aromatic ring-hydroxylating dioxygenase subunit alpha [Haliea sp. SAOS-164]TGD74773.1 aromatic ring-hydroxylating dioxygenase subunit alpha [Haliea sp. SAOS-164]
MTAEPQRFQPVPREAHADLGTGPIPAQPYYTREYFELEREAIFKRSWLQIGHVCEIPEPGDFLVRPVEVADASILITRDAEGELHAFHNVCTHRGTQLVDASCGKRSRFSCPYHMWTFSNRGDLVSAPDFENFYVDQASCALPRVAVDVCAGQIFINLDKSPRQGLREFLGPLAEQMERLPMARATAISEYVYEVDANWKLTYDNFQENYHLRFIHPRSGEMAGGPQNPFGYPERYAFHGPHRTQTIWSNPDARPLPFQLLAFTKVAQFAMQDQLDMQIRDYFGVFPNLFVLGTATTHFSQSIMPIAENRTRSVIRLYWIGEDDCASRRFAREFNMTTALDIHSEDRAVIEAGHRGLASGALSHIHFQSQEVLCRHLFNEVDRRVQDYRAELAAAGGVQ